LLGTAWPLLTLAIIVLLLLRACVPIADVLAAFDAAAATRLANERASATIGALGGDATIEQVGRSLNLVVVNFASGSAEIPADAKPVLARAASLLAALPAGSRFEIRGHTDNAGSPAGNLRLSEQRARAVVGFLLSQGTPANRLVARGYGDSRPIGDNATERGRFGNRRIEFAPLP
jgi:outer membrane protein OmpA-like peptidoglycan-associated protein